MSCELCVGAGGLPVWADARLRVVRVADDDFPGFYRVVWNGHVAELSDLADADRAHCMAAVVRVERTLRERLRPTKVNLASLGNVTPHLHWHVVARFDWDSHWPQPIWAAAGRAAPADAASRLAVPLDALDAAVRAALEGPAGGASR